MVRYYGKHQSVLVLCTCQTLQELPTACVWLFKCKFSFEWLSYQYHVPPASCQLCTATLSRNGFIKLNLNCNAISWQQYHTLHPIFICKLGIMMISFCHGLTIINLIDLKHDCFLLPESLMSCECLWSVYIPSFRFSFFYFIIENRKGITKHPFPFF